MCDEYELPYDGAPTPESVETLYSPCNATRHEAEIISPSLRKSSVASSSSSASASSKAASTKAQKKRAATTAKKPKKQPMPAAVEDSEMQDGSEPHPDEQQTGSPTSKKAAMAMRKQASLDQRRRRNREAMQRARQRDKDYMDGLRDSARDLERKHNALLAQVNERIAQISITGQLNERARGLQGRLQSARDQAEALKRQNLQFLDEIGDRIKREDRMEGLLRELMREQSTQELMLTEIFRESISESQMSIFYTEERAMREIMRSRSDRCQVERQGFAGAAVGDIFGWSTQYLYEDKHFFFSFAKTFRNQSAARVMDQNWMNAMKMVSYRSASEIAAQRWQTLQKINDDTYLIAREALDPEKDGEYVRLLYLRFRLREPDGSFAIVTQSVLREEASPYERVGEIWATDACMWTLFTPVAERRRDGSELEHCQVKMVGKSTVGSETTARTNILESILGLLRWENANVGPMLSLDNSSS
ncbi:hypothetical protein PybrP1_003835 [[Pythium] brassicae (nom. inval.)]|nr:hypothetical protein PybrP1_003835 [[Pythium] brassicae (nom. inval.)]